MTVRTDEATQSAVEVPTAEAGANFAGGDFDRVAPFTVLGTPLLSEGRSMKLIAVAPQLWVHAKVYSQGGERGLHSHPTEDHLFFVLSGGANFRDATGGEYHVGPYEGIMIPRGVEYEFESDGEENFIVLRVGAGSTSEKMAAMAVQGANGQPAKRPGTGVPIPGAVFTGR